MAMETTQRKTGMNKAIELSMLSQITLWLNIIILNF
jgi:hypothetical protein